jgi:cell division protein FtsI (penicillin-binding protein 3)
VENNKGDILWRIYLVYFLTAGFSVLIFLKVIYIQFVEGEHWRDLARNSTMRYVNIDAVRGDIIADDGRLLATSVPVYEIRMDLHRGVISDQVFHSGIDSLALQLSRLFRDRSQSEYKRVITQARREQERYFLIKRNVNYHQLTELRNFPILRLGRFRGGLLVIERNRRETPFKSLASRTIGFEREGVYVGLEGAYRDYLEGVQGKRLMQRISGGNWMPVNDENEIKSQNGKDIITTININMQDVVENSLKRQLNRYQAQHGTAVVMEVKTGRIKAISNLTRNTAGGYEESFNYAVGESAEPGSTFKLASMMVALEDGVVSPDDFVQTDDGRIAYADRIMRDAREGGFGTITVKNAFEVSSNVAISRIINDAYGKDPGKFVKRLKDMGLDKPLGLEIRGEGVPFIPDVENASWSGVTLPWMSIGYGVSFTPVQTLAFYNAVANDGKMMKPMFVDEVRHTGRTIKRFDPQVINRSVCSANTLRIIKEMLEGVVENGTAKAIKSDLYAIAGKTGTAQVANTRKGYRGEGGVVYRASFAGYFPADDPMYSMIVVIHNPKGWIFSGSQVAAPVFRDIADKIYATQLLVPADDILHPDVASLPVIRAGAMQDIKNIYAEFECKLIYNKKNQWVSTERYSNDTIILAERELIPNLVPDVTGMGLRDALYLLENSGLRVRFAGRGVVRSQSIRPGTRINQGSQIFIQLS